MTDERDELERAALEAFPRNWQSGVDQNAGYRCGFVEGGKWQARCEELSRRIDAYKSDRWRECAEKMAEALKFYSAMKFNREIMQWMPGGPDKAINALAIFEKLKGEK